MTQFGFVKSANVFLCMVFFYFGCSKNCKEEILYFKNGNIKFQYTICHNKINGLFFEYFENGKLKTKGNYKNGLRYGIFYEYNNDSTLFGIDYYENGKLNGYSIGIDRKYKIYIEYNYNEILKQIVVDTTNQILGNYFYNSNIYVINYVSNWKIYKINKGDTLYFNSNKKLIKFVSKNKTTVNNDEIEEYKKLIPNWQLEIEKMKNDFSHQQSRYPSPL